MSRKIGVGTRFSGGNAIGVEGSDTVVIHNRQMNPVAGISYYRVADSEVIVGTTPDRVRPESDGPVAVILASKSGAAWIQGKPARAGTDELSPRAESRGAIINREHPGFH